jgi:hypothetical protein
MVRLGGGSAASRHLIQQKRSSLISNWGAARLLADAVLATRLRRIQSRLGLLQNAHNLLLRIPALLHGFPVGLEPLASIMGELSLQVD